MGTKSFPKQEHLKSRKKIQALFQKGEAFSVFPLRLLYLKETGTAVPPQVGFSVPSRRFKKAVDRNRIKRLLREAYRHQKQDLLLYLKNKDLSLHLFFIYTGKEIPDYPFLSKKMAVSLERLLSKLQTKDEINQ